MLQGIFGADGVFLDMMGSRLGFIQKFYILFDFPGFNIPADGFSPPTCINEKGHSKFFERRAVIKKNTDCVFLFLLINVIKKFDLLLSDQSFNLF